MYSRDSWSVQLTVRPHACCLITAGVLWSPWQSSTVQPLPFLLFPLPRCTPPDRLLLILFNGIVLFFLNFNFYFLKSTLFSTYLDTLTICRFFSMFLAFGECSNSSGNCLSVSGSGRKVNYSFKTQVLLMVGVMDIVSSCCTHPLDIPPEGCNFWSEAWC